MVQDGRPRPAVNRDSRPPFVGQSAAAVELQARIETVAARNCTVLIEGESGVGKEVMVRQIHTCSPRCSHPLIPVEATTLTESLFESQLGVVGGQT